MVNPSKIDTFRQNGQAINTIFHQLIKLLQEERDLTLVDQAAEKLMNEAGGEPAFKRVPNYNWSTCICVNSGFVHCIPQGIVRDGDIVTLDTGMYLDGTTTDLATTIAIGTPTKKIEDFLQVGRSALKKAIHQAQPGNTVRHISQTLQDTIQAAGYTVTRHLTGHGLGKTMHEPPSIPCFVTKDPLLNTQLKPGMVLAIEAMYMQGSHQLTQADDGWTVKTADGKLSAMFEEDVLITESGPELLTHSTLESLD